MAERKGFDCSIECDFDAAAGECGNKTCMVQAQDICPDGLKILTDHPLEQGMVVRLGFPVSGFELLLPVFAEVAWALPVSNRFKAGLRFLK